MNVADCDFIFIPMNVKDIDLVCVLMNELGRLMTDWDAYLDELAVNLNGSEACLEIINDYLLPNGKMNIAKCSDNMYQIVRKEFYRDIYTLEKTAAQAA